VTNPTLTNSAEKYPKAISSPQSPIRSIDFKNFTYPARPVYRKGQTTFTLTNGRYEGRIRLTGGTGPFGEPYPISFVGVVYGDATGDGKEEAMVVLYERVAGTAIPYYVYIFAMNSDRTKLLWAFEPGDRADGGLRKVYGERGALMIELYGKDAKIGDIEDKEEDTPACCPKSFTKTRYEWNGKGFVQSGRSEVLPNPINNAELLLE
jgi:hypothetical protein